MPHAPSMIPGEKCARSSRSWTWSAVAPVAGIRAGNFVRGDSAAANGFAFAGRAWAPASPTKKFRKSAAARGTCFGLMLADASRSRPIPERILLRGRETRGKIVVTIAANYTAAPPSRMSLDFLRKRLERSALRSLRESGSRIDRFKLTAKSRIRETLLADPEIGKAVARHAKEHDVEPATVWPTVERYVDEIVP